MNLIFHSRTSPRTTVVAVIDGHTACFGASRCSKKDQFSRKRGREIATGRARKNPYLTSPVPKTDIARWFISRSQEITQSIQQNPELLNK